MAYFLLAERKTVFAERTTLLGERSKRESFNKYQEYFKLQILKALDLFLSYQKQG